MDILFLIKAVATLVGVVVAITLWRVLLSSLSRKVSISITESEISFSWEGRTIKLKPYVYISKAKKQKRVLGIGEPPAVNDTYFEANIFNLSEEAKSQASIEAFIQVFFRSAFVQLLNRRVLVFTEVTVKGTDNLKNTLGSNYLEIFDKCLKVAGSIKRNYTEQQEA